MRRLLSFFFIVSVLLLVAGHAAPSVLVCGGDMMKGDHFADSVLPVLREHYAGGRTVVLVLHASHPAERDRMERRLQTAFAHLNGMKATSLHRSDEAGARELLTTAARRLCWSASWCGRARWR